MLKIDSTIEARFDEARNTLVIKRRFFTWSARWKFVKYVVSEHFKNNPLAFPLQATASILAFLGHHQFFIPVLLGSFSVDTSTSNTSNTSLSFTIGSTANLVLFGISTQQADPATATYGGQSMTQQVDFVNGGLKGTFWTLVNPPTGANTFSPAVSGQNYKTCFGISFIGANTSSPIDGSVGTNASAGVNVNVQNTISTTVDGDVVVNFWFDSTNNSSNTSAHSGDAGQTDIFTATGSTPGGASYLTKASHGSVTMGGNANDGNTTYAAMIIAIKPNTSTAWTTTLTDSISISDTLAKTAQKAVADTLSIIESFTKTGQKVVIDTISLSEVFVIGKVYLTALVDALSLTEFFTKSPSTTFTDNFSISESFSKVLTRSFTEIFSVTETIQRFITRAFTETYSLIDIVVHFCLNGLLPIWNHKYFPKNSSYADKYSARSTTYTDKLSSPNTSYADKYPHPPC